MTEPWFEACLSIVLQLEGGYADNPADPGGATNMGITRKTLARWRNISPWWALGTAEVKALQRAEAAKIYRASYWDRCTAGQMPAGLDLAVFDYAVNSGPDRAIKTLQALLGVKADGQVGPLTLAAIGRYSVRTLIDALCDRRLSFLQGLKTFASFGRGWTSRVATIRQSALAVAPIDSTNPVSNGEPNMSFLNGYKTYIVAAFMLLVGLAQVLGIALPAMDGGSSAQMILQALAVIFLRQGIKNDLNNA